MIDRRRGSDPPLSRRDCLRWSLYASLVASPGFSSLGCALAPRSAVSPEAPRWGLQHPWWTARFELDARQLALQDDLLSAQGYQLEWLDADDAPRPFAALWTREQRMLRRAYVARTDPGDLESELQSRRNHGDTLLALIPYRDAGAKHFASLWEPELGRDWHAFLDLDSRALAERIRLEAERGYQPGHLHSTATSSGRRYQLVTEVAAEERACHFDLTLDAFRQQDERYRKAGLALHRVNLEHAGHDRRLGAIWIARSSASNEPQASAAVEAPAFAEPSALAESLEAATAQASLPSSLSLASPLSASTAARTWRCAGVLTRRERQWQETGTIVPELASFDAAMREFMQARNIPGGSLAVTRDSRLVFARGYRWSPYAFDGIEATTRFRIASISKPITAVAILKLVQDDRLRLDDSLPALLGFESDCRDARWHTITVRRALQHLGGWDRKLAFDPMFRDREVARFHDKPLPVSIDEIIAYMLNEPLQHDPGTHYSYSNFGYCLLGRVIEAITGRRYDDFMQREILQPLGIRNMRLGHSLLEERLPEEALYYVPELSLKPNLLTAEAAEEVMQPYGNFRQENLDAHGGWIASAIDLVRFASQFDRPDEASLLHPETVTTMFAEPETGIHERGWYYGCGWLVRPGPGGPNTWHGGSLPGTHTLLVRRRDGLNWAVLFNQRSDSSDLPYGAIDGMLHRAANAVQSWPNSDRFSDFG